MVLVNCSGWGFQRQSLIGSFNLRAPREERATAAADALDGASDDRPPAPDRRGSGGVIPLTALWFDADAVGRMLSLSGRVVRERIALRPGGIGHPWWNAAEVDAWMRRQRDGA